MKLTILGNNGPFPAAGGACSGYLVQEGSTNLLIDCGNGVLSNLQKIINIEDLDAIILTHLHSDHISDMMVLKYAIQVKKDKGALNKTFNVFAPQEPAEEYKRINIKNVFEMHPVTEELKLQFGILKVSFREMKHPVKCYGISADNGSKRFVFSGDTAWNENIIDFSMNADLLMLDAGLLTKDKSSEDVPHLTAAECGMIAARAEVKRLILTHFWPEYELSEILGEARQYFQNAELSKLLNSYEI
ncbi:MAG: MBL fold metallo-hydrolase [Clostridia bacterium]|nr:MBL fold metallo-hydrolase [Clostridia bacterium]